MLTVKSRHHIWLQYIILIGFLATTIGKIQSYYKYNGLEENTKNSPSLPTIYLAGDYTSDIQSGLSDNISICCCSQN